MRVLLWVTVSAVVVIAAVVIAVWFARRESFTAASFDPYKIDLYGTMLEQTESKSAYRKAAASGDALRIAKALATRARTHAQSSVPFALRLQNIPSANPAAVRCIDQYKLAVAAEQRALASGDAAVAQQEATAAETARIACQDELLSAMMVSTDPVRDVEFPPHAIDDCLNFSAGVGPTGGPNRSLAPGQARLIQFLQFKGRELLAHMINKYPNDPLTKNLTAHWSRRVLPMSLEYESAKDAWMATAGVYTSRCIFVHMQLTGSVPRSLTRMIHELAHIAADTDGQEGHTPKFYDAERRMLRIATDELGWTVENWCREVCDIAKDTRVTDPKAACPRCTWQKDPALCVKEDLKKDVICRPKGEEESDSNTIPAPTPADLVSLKADAVAAGSRVEAMAAKVNAIKDPRTKALAVAQVARVYRGVSNAQTATDPFLAKAYTQMATQGAKAVDALIDNVTNPLTKNPKKSSGAPCRPDQKWREANTPQEQTLLDVLRKRATQFARHLAEKYASDPRAQTFLNSWNGTVNISTKSTGATYYTRNGCMIINPYTQKSKKNTSKKNTEKEQALAKIQTPGTIPGMDDMGRLLTRMLHEMAHSSGIGHDAVFYDAQRWFLKIASEELNWPLVVTCRVCCHSKTPCTQACPKCIWLDSPDTCAATDRACGIE